jgi:guanylate kinase
MDVLKQRLVDRGTDSAQQIQRRLEVAESELQAIFDFDYAVPNDNLERCVTDLQRIIRAERSQSLGDVSQRFSPVAAEERFRGART